jgi:uncharacterized protein (DUF1015 family)
MANIKPFRGIRFNTERFDDLSKLVSQPYDRIFYGLQEKYYALSEYNVVRLIRNRQQPGDDQTDNVYTRARDLFGTWLGQGVLSRDSQRALYVYHQTFTTPGGESLTRMGFITALELTTFDKGIVLPHERTHSGPKADRLNLLRTTEANLELIFLVYPDPENRVNRLLDAAVESLPPDIDVTEMYEADVRQRVWAVTAPKVIEAVQEEMRPKTRLIIADGHHRYETSLNYRNEMRAAKPGAPPDAAFNYRMVMLVSMDDPGLVILPTHREVFGYDRMTAEELLAKAGSLFAVTRTADRAACFAAMAQPRSQHAIGFYDGQAFYLLVLRDPKSLNRLIPEDRASAWKSLDVTILHNILLEQIAGIPREAVDAEQFVRYHRSPDYPIAAVDKGEANFAFFLNPTQMAQVKACAEIGEKMPQKSTDFYPKAISGLVMFPVGGDERLP